MKVILVNGSPHKNGNTNEALAVISEELKKCNVETEIFWIGAKPIGGCIACLQCREKGKCVFEDTVNEFVEIAKDADGFIFGTPVHFAAMGGNIASFMDRAFYSASLSGRTKHFMFKPVASIITARRAGTTATYDQINKYFGISQMPIISTRYWNMVHSGYGDPKLINQDVEGIQMAKMLARNMAYYLKCIDAGKKNGVNPPEQEETIYTNFIR